MTNLPAPRTDTTPRRIEWQGPEGFVVILDEDGVMLRAPKGGLEESDLNRLLDVIAEAKRARDAGSAPIPLPPSREHRRYYPEAYLAGRAKRAASRAIDAEFNPTDAPF